MSNRVNVDINANVQGLDIAMNKMLRPLENMMNKLNRMPGGTGTSQNFAITPRGADAYAQVLHRSAGSTGLTEKDIEKAVTQLRELVQMRQVVIDNIQEHNVFEATQAMDEYLKLTQDFVAGQNEIFAKVAERSNSQVATVRMARSQLQEVQKYSKSLGARQYGQQSTNEKFRENIADLISILDTLSDDGPISAAMQQLTIQGDIPKGTMQRVTALQTKVNAFRSGEAKSIRLGQLADDMNHLMDVFHQIETFITGRTDSLNEQRALLDEAEENLRQNTTVTADKAGAAAHGRREQQARSMGNTAFRRPTGAWRAIHGADSDPFSAENYDNFMDFTQHFGPAVDMINNELRNIFSNVIGGLGAAAVFMTISSISETAKDIGRLTDNMAVYERLLQSRGATDAARRTAELRSEIEQLSNTTGIALERLSDMFRQLETRNISSNGVRELVATSRALFEQFGVDAQAVLSNTVENYKGMQQQGLSASFYLDLTRLNPQQAELTTAAVNELVMMNNALGLSHRELAAAALYYAETGQDVVDSHVGINKAVQDGMVILQNAQANMVRLSRDQTNLVTAMFGDDAEVREAQRALGNAIKQTWQNFLGNIGVGGGSELFMNFQSALLGVLGVLERITALFKWLSEVPGVNIISSFMQMVVAASVLGGAVFAVTKVVQVLLLRVGDLRKAWLAAMGPSMRNTVLSVLGDIRAAFTGTTAAATAGMTRAATATGRLGAALGVVGRLATGPLGFILGTIASIGIGQLVSYFAQRGAQDGLDRPAPLDRETLAEQADRYFNSAAALTPEQRVVLRRDDSMGNALQDARIALNSAEAQVDDVIDTHAELTAELATIDATWVGAVQALEAIRPPQLGVTTAELRQAMDDAGITDASDMQMFGRQFMADAAAAGRAPTNWTTAFGGGISNWLAEAIKAFAGGGLTEMDDKRQLQTQLDLLIPYLQNADTIRGISTSDLQGYDELESMLRAFTDEFANADAIARVDRHNLARVNEIQELRARIDGLRSVSAGTLLNAFGPHGQSIIDDEIAELEGSISMKIIEGYTETYNLTRDIINTRDNNLQRNIDILQNLLQYHSNIEHELAAANARGASTQSIWDITKMRDGVFNDIVNAKEQVIQYARNLRDNIYRVENAYLDLVEADFLSAASNNTDLNRIVELTLRQLEQIRDLEGDEYADRLATITAHFTSMLPIMLERDQLMRAVNSHLRQFDGSDDINDQLAILFNALADYSIPEESRARESLIAGLIHRFDSDNGVISRLRDSSVELLEGVAALVEDAPQAEGLLGSVVTELDEFVTGFDEYRKTLAAAIDHRATLGASAVAQATGEINNLNVELENAQGMLDASQAMYDQLVLDWDAGTATPQDVARKGELESTIAEQQARVKEIETRIAGLEAQIVLLNQVTSEKLDELQDQLEQQERERLEHILEFVGALGAYVDETLVGLDEVSLRVRELSRNNQLHQPDLREQLKENLNTLYTEYEDIITTLALTEQEYTNMINLLLSQVAEEDRDDAFNQQIEDLQSIVEFLQGLQTDTRSELDTAAAMTIGSNQLEEAQQLLADIQPALDKFNRGEGDFNAVEEAINAVEEHLRGSSELLAHGGKVLEDFNDTVKTTVDNAYKAYFTKQRNDAEQAMQTAMNAQLGREEAIALLPEGVSPLEHAINALSNYETSTLEAIESGRYSQAEAQQLASELTDARAGITDMLTQLASDGEENLLRNPTRLLELLQGELGFSEQMIAYIVNRVIGDEITGQLMRDFERSTRGISDLRRNRNTNFADFENAVGTSLTNLTSLHEHLDTLQEMGLNLHEDHPFTRELEEAERALESTIRDTASDIIGNLRDDRSLEGITPSEIAERLANLHGQLRTFANETGVNLTELLEDITFDLADVLRDVITEDINFDNIEDAEDTLRNILSPLPADMIDVLLKNLSEPLREKILEIIETESRILESQLDTAKAHFAAQLDTNPLEALTGIAETTDNMFQNYKAQLRMIENQLQQDGLDSQQREELQEEYRNLTMTFVERYKSFVEEVHDGILALEGQVSTETLLAAVRGLEELTTAQLGELMLEGGELEELLGDSAGSVIGFLQTLLESILLLTGDAEREVQAILTNRQILIGRSATNRADMDVLNQLAALEEAEAPVTSADRLSRDGEVFRLIAALVSREQRETARTTSWHDPQQAGNVAAVNFIDALMSLSPEALMEAYPGLRDEGDYEAAIAELSRLKLEFQDTMLTVESMFLNLWRGILASLQNAFTGFLRDIMMIPAQMQEDERRRLEELDDLEFQHRVNESRLREYERIRNEMAETYGVGSEEAARYNEQLIEARARHEELSRAIEKNKESSKDFYEYLMEALSRFLDAFMDALSQLAAQQLTQAIFGMLIPGASSSTTNVVPAGFNSDGSRQRMGVDFDAMAAGKTPSTSDVVTAGVGGLGLQGMLTSAIAGPGASMLTTAAASAVSGGVIMMGVMALSALVDKAQALYEEYKDLDQMRIMDGENVFRDNPDIYDIVQRTNPVVHVNIHGELDRQRISREAAAQTYRVMGKDLLD